MKTRIINTIIALAGILALNVACQREEFILPDMDAAPDGYVNLRFDVDVPGMDQVQTKAVDPDGGGVQSLSVFCFDANGLFITVISAELVSNSADMALTGSFRASVPNFTKNVHLVANQNLTYFQNDNYRGMSEVDVMAALEASAGRMIYWAKKTVEELQSPTGPVELLRNQAKITLEVQSGVNFNEKGWIVVNTNAFGTVAPYSPEYGFVAPEISSPFVTIPENNAKLNDFLDVRTNDVEYIFETENTSADPVDFIVKGSQNGGKDLYYRISLLDENGGNVMIMRNHHYTVNIVGELYYGQESFQEALEAPATNNVWVSVADYISQVEDGKNSLEVEKTYVVIGEEEFKEPNTYYLKYTVKNLDGTSPSRPEVYWLDGNNVASNSFTHDFDSSTGEGSVLINLNRMGELQKREGTLFIKYGRLSRKIKVVTVKEQKFEPAWITTNIYGKEAGENVTMMFTIPEDCPAELFPMDVLLSVNDMDIRHASGMVLPIITDTEEGYGEPNDVGYKYVLTVHEPGMQSIYMHTILDHTGQGENTVKVTVEAPHFVTLSKTATFQSEIQSRILVHNLLNYVGDMPADEYIYYYLVPQKINAPVEFESHLGEVVGTAADADITLTNPIGKQTHYRYISPNTDFAGNNVDEFLLYSQYLEHNHDHDGTFYFDFFKDLNPANWSASGGRVLGFYRNEETAETGATLHLKTTRPKSDEVIRIASNVKGATSVTTGSPGELAAGHNYTSPDGLCNGTGLYKSCVFELVTYHPFHFAATVNGEGTNVQGDNEETVDNVLLSYKPDQTINIEFDVTSFMSSIKDTEGNSILADEYQESVDPFGTAFDIYIDAPMLSIDTSCDLYKTGKVTRHPSIEGRYVYHVAADRDEERGYGNLEATKDNKAVVSQVGERKIIPFKTKSIVSAGDIIISSDESKVVYYQKRFRIQNESMTGRIQYGDNIDIPAGSFVPFEVTTSYNRIGTIAIGSNGTFELRLRSEYKYDWQTDQVKFQYADDSGKTYECVFTSLKELYEQLEKGKVILLQ